MRMAMSFLARLESTVSRYLAEVAGPRERLALLRWQIGERHALDRRETMPGHVTTSAFVLSPDHTQILLIDHVVIGRWLQPGGHYEPAASFHESALREAVEETGVASADCPGGGGPCRGLEADRSASGDRAAGVRAPACAEPGQLSRWQELLPRRNNTRA